MAWRKNGKQKPTCDEPTIWNGMITRCLDATSAAFKNYGGRGIKVCQRWRKDQDGMWAFVEDVGRRPSPDHSLDRIDNNGHYSCGHCDECIANGWPANCRWVTAKEQSLNMRTNIRALIDGKLVVLLEVCREEGVEVAAVKKRFKHVGDWRRAIELAKIPNWQPRMLTVDDIPAPYRERGERIGLTGAAIAARIRNGWSIEEAVTMTAEEAKERDSQRRRKRIEIGGELVLEEELCKSSGKERATVKTRMRKGMSLEEALNTPLMAGPKWIKIGDDTKILKEWLVHFGLKTVTYYKRIEAGWSVLDALMTPVGKKPGPNPNRRK